MWAGIVLSTASILSGFFGTGFRRMVSMVIGAGTGSLWLLALAVSSAVRNPKPSIVYFHDWSGILKGLNPGRLFRWAEVIDACREHLAMGRAR
jgi:hypothetical protein